MDASAGVVLLVLAVAVCGHEGDRDFKMCGRWSHGSSVRKLDVNLTRGCSGITVSANESVLSIRGAVTAKCVHADVLLLEASQLSFSNFCVTWEPLLDQLGVEVNGTNFLLCHAAGLQTQCCAHLSPGPQIKSISYGIIDAIIHGDGLSSNAMTSYKFIGELINCKEYFCSKTAQEARGANMLEEVVMRSEEFGPVSLPCVQSIVLEMKEDFAGLNVTLPAMRGAARESVPRVLLPACLKPAARKQAKVVCSYYKNSTFFQKRGGQKILEDVVGISVENEIITNLPEPVRIRFYHPGLMKRKCVFWDTRKDEEVTWRESGCMTLHLSAVETECCCNHLTYFAVLVDVNPTRTLRHLEALTFISAVCCAVSIASCAVLFISLCRQRKLKNQSSLAHRGLVVALFFLLLLFVLSGTVANVASDNVCVFMGGLLHYTLISVLCWMAVEVFHTFWMMYMVFNSTLKPWIWYMLGFGVPAVPVVILGCVGNVYGKRTVKSADVLKTPYHMCWMTDSSPALTAHFIINTGLLAAVVSSGLIMLLLVFRKIRHRDEWRRNRVAFLSIWGLSCLFGSTWVLAFFSSEPSEIVLFLFCIINSLQGFFLMLRFFALERMQRNNDSSSEDSSTASTRQHMLHTQDRN